MARFMRALIWIVTVVIVGILAYSCSLLRIPDYAAYIIYALVILVAFCLGCKACVPVGWFALLVFTATVTYMVTVQSRMSAVVATIIDFSVAAVVFVTIRFYRYEMANEICWLCVGFLLLTVNKVACRCTDRVFTSALEAFARARGMYSVDHKSLTYKNIPMEITTHDGSAMLSGLLISPSTVDERTPLPVVIFRTPYGFDSVKHEAEHFAYRGYRAVTQLTRGCFDSTGPFYPVIHEQHDGGALLDWVLEQSWCNGKVAAMGVSYVGFAAWAIAGSSAGQAGKLAALVAFNTSSRLAPILLHDLDEKPSASQGVVAIDLGLRWTYVVLDLPRRSALIGPYRLLVSAPQVDKAVNHIPLCEADVKLVNTSVNFFQDAICSTRGDESFWRSMDVLCPLSSEGTVVPPVYIVGGWYGIFLKQTIQDYINASNSKPETTFLTVFDGSHFGLPLRSQGTVLSAAIDFLDEHMGQPARPATPRVSTSRICPEVIGIKKSMPVNIQVLRTHEWISLTVWPPPTTARLFLLQSGFTLGERCVDGTSSCSSNSYQYDPADPTPAIGGNTFNHANSGMKNQALLECRKDVLVYTSLPIEENELLVLGEIHAKLFVSSSVRQTDFVARLCVVDCKGRSVNICDGITRIDCDAEEPPLAACVGGDKVWQINVSLGHTAFGCQRGERLRLHLCSAAHPRWLRNYGTSEPVATATRFAQAAQTVHFGAQFSSLIVIPQCQRSTLTVT